MSTVFMADSSNSYAHIFSERNPKGQQVHPGEVEVLSNDDSLHNHPADYESRPTSASGFIPSSAGLKRSETYGVSNLRISSPPISQQQQQQRNKRPADDAAIQNNRSGTPPNKNRRSHGASPSSDPRRTIPIRNAPAASPALSRNSMQYPENSADRPPAVIPPFNFDPVKNQFSFPLSNEQQQKQQPLQTSNRSSEVYQKQQQHQQQLVDDKPRHFEDSANTVIKQPDARPISAAQLAAEVKAIYAGLALVETKCISVVTQQAHFMREKKSGDHHWPSLIALHRALLHEHHDFFLASQHPSATPALRDLATKYSMPARMWRHGIHNFLELLRHELPASLEYMLAFIYLAYQMMALLYETVPSFADTWIECLGDLARYRMAVEDEDLRDREVWTGVAKYWYSKAINKHASVGRLHHHLAILSRSHAIPQLSLYCRALSTNQPFLSAKESIKTLLDPMLKPNTNFGRAPPVEIETVRCHAVLFYSRYDMFEGPFQQLMSLLDPHIARVTTRFRDQGACIAIANCTAVLKYGSPSAIRNRFEEYFKDSSDPAKALMKAMEASKVAKLADGADGRDPDTLPVWRSSDKDMAPAWRLFLGDFSIMLKRVGDHNVLPHVLLVVFFSWTLSVAYGSDYLDESYPFALLGNFLTAYARTESIDPSFESSPLSPPTSGESIILPEDYALRGLVWSKDIYTSNFYDKATPDEDERVMEFPSTGKIRVQRVLWAAIQLASISVEKMFVSDDIELIEDPSIASQHLGADRVRSKTWLAWNSHQKEFYARTYHAVSREDAKNLARLSAVGSFDSVPVKQEPLDIAMEGQNMV